MLVPADRLLSSQEEPPSCSEAYHVAGSIEPAPQHKRQSTSFASKAAGLGLGAGKKCSHQHTVFIRFRSFRFDAIMGIKRSKHGVAARIHPERQDICA